MAGRAREADSGLSFQEQCPELSRSTDVMKKRLLPPSSTGHIAVISVPRTKPYNHGYCPCWQKGTESERLYYATSHRVKNWLGESDGPMVCHVLVAEKRGQLQVCQWKRSLPSAKTHKVKNSQMLKGRGRQCVYKTNKDLMSISWHSK